MHYICLVFADVCTYITFILFFSAWHYYVDILQRSKPLLQYGNIHRIISTYYIQEVVACE